MLRPFYLISIQQVPNSQYPTRNSLFELDFVNEYEIESTWENHTDCAKVSLPKNVQLKTEDFLFKQSGTYNVILGGSQSNTDKEGNAITYPPLIMKGDAVTISDGYWYKNRQRIDIQTGSTQFSGYVSKVHSDVPIKIDCEDNFYLLKRTPVNKTTYEGNLLGLCQFMLDQVNSLFGNNNDKIVNGINPYPILTLFSNPDSITANFSLGHLDIGNVTCAQLLDRLRTQYHLESFFIGNVLHFGFPIYDESTANNKNVFEFQNNIFDDCQLEYKNKSDVILSAIVTSHTIKATGRKTRDGELSTKKERKSVLIYWDIPTETFKYLEKKKGENFPANDGGERHEFVYPIDPADGEPSTATLVDFGTKQLEKYYYTGFRGSFKTIGFPFVKWGDNVVILDPVMADRNGVYKVKKVVRSGGVDNSIEQEIFLDYKLNIVVPTTFTEIYMI
jgi:hypothetical protein